MGIYLVSVAAEDWFGEEEGGWAEVASGLNAELRRRGLQPYEDVPPATAFVAGSGQAFEEKAAPSMTGFVALCERYLSREELEILCGWMVIVPVSLDEEVSLPVDSGYGEPTVVVGAPQVLLLAEKLAAAIDLPPEIPATCDNLDLSKWFRSRAKELAATRTGLWSTDLDTAFYVAVFLRAAQHSIRRRCPIVYS
ncbi:MULTISPECIES: hypothetical protein [Actinomycetes]|uniref:hypothetical protein n=1 Tax=Actinomycetes TaxID=1760 RepID=UPI0006AEA872|nr:hypothetical protein [Streptomyces sp. WM6368]KOU36271.1 hypothetical protein ADK51_04230 [Streptomyces sp. WM6368]